MNILNGYRMQFPSFSEKFSDNLNLLPMMDKFVAIELLDQSGAQVGKIENKPGQAGSLRVYCWLAETFGSITPEAADLGLKIYAEHTQDARTNPGSIPTLIGCSASERQTRRCRSGSCDQLASANIKKHGVSFADAEGVLEDPLAVTLEDADAKGEQRFITIGLGSAGELLVLVWTERNGEYRPISARRPTRKERKHYEG